MNHQHEQTLEFSKTYRPISRIILDCPIKTANRLPKALRSTRTFRAVSAPPVPKTVVKKTPAAISSDSANSFLGTVQSVVSRATWAHIESRTSSEICNVAEHIKNCHHEQRDKAMLLDGWDWTFDLIDHVERVGVATV